MWFGQIEWIKGDGGGAVEKTSKPHASNYNNI